MSTIEGQLNGEGRRVGIVASRFNERIVEQMLAGALDCLRRHGVGEVDLVLVRVPGAWEIPLALAKLAQRGSLDGLVGIGAVIRGQTPHFEYVCSQCIAGMRHVQEEHGVPVGLGVLTCDDSQQAEERAGGKAGNKGWEAALATLEMIDTLRKIEHAT